MGKQFKGFIVGFILACLLVVPTTALADNIQAYFNTVNISVDGKNAVKQGDNYQLSDGSAVPFSINYKGTTYIPIRKVGELLGIGINYDNSSKTVQITSNSNNTNIPAKPENNKTTNAGITYTTSYSVFYECDRDANQDGDKVVHVVGFKDGYKIDAYYDHVYYKTISSNINSILLWETTIDSKGNLAKLKAVPSLKSGKVVTSDRRNSVTLSSGDYNFENNVILYQWTEDNEYKVYSGNLKKDDEVYLYDTNGNKKYDVAIFTRDYKGKASEGDTSANKQDNNINNNDNNKDKVEKPSKSSTGFAVIVECNKDSNEKGDKVQQIQGFYDGKILRAITSEKDTVEDWSEPKLTSTGFSNAALYKIRLDSKDTIISAEKINADLEQHKVEKAEQRNDVTIDGKTYNLSRKVLIYQVTEHDEYKVFNGNLKDNDVVQLYETDSSEDGYDIVIFSRPERVS